jgi:hypothetical protein
MTGHSDPSIAAPAVATFELERFIWDGPDRLALAGRFKGIRGAGAPALLLRGPGGEQRLLPVPDTGGGPPEDGGPWQAEFAWTDAPMVFESVLLGIGDDLVVDLPLPDGRRRRFGRRVLDVRSTAPPHEGRELPSPTGDDGTRRLRLEADLILAREEARTLRGDLERLQDELAANRAAVAAERESHAADTERFRHEVAGVSQAAEKAVAADRFAAERAEERVAEQEAALAAAHADVDALRARVAELESEARAAGALREERDRLKAALTAARSVVEEVLGRLRSLDDGDPERPAE